ncbi:hypothetical protein EMMF5_004583 [Cystobasidiomycetes sp. EMM_F5]
MSSVAPTTPIDIAATRVEDTVQAEGTPDLAYSQSGLSDASSDLSSEADSDVKHLYEHNEDGTVIIRQIQGEHTPELPGQAGPGTPEEIERPLRSTKKYTNLARFFQRGGNVPYTARADRITGENNVDIVEAEEESGNESDDESDSDWE